MVSAVMEIPPFRLVPKPMNDAAATLPAFKWADPEIGTRHQLGGRPLTIQAVGYPSCPVCREEMAFYAQPDSINEEYCVADAGLIYGFICFECSQVAAVVDTS